MGGHAGEKVRTVFKPEQVKKVELVEKAKKLLHLCATVTKRVISGGCLGYSVLAPSSNGF